MNRPVLNSTTREEKALPLEPQPAAAGDWLFYPVHISTLPPYSSWKARFMSQLAEGQRSMRFGMASFLPLPLLNVLFYFTSPNTGFSSGQLSTGALMKLVAVTPAGLVPEGCPVCFGFMR